MTTIAAVDQLIATESLLVEGPSPQLSRLFRALGHPLPSQEGLEAFYDDRHAAACQEVGELAEESLAVTALASTAVQIGIALSIRHLLHRIAVRSKKSTLEGDKNTERLEEVMKEVKTERSRKGLIARALFSRVRNTVETVAKETMRDLRKELESGDMTEEEKVKAKALLKKYDEEIRKKGIFSSKECLSDIDAIEEMLDPTSLNDGSDDGEISEEKLDLETKVRITAALTMLGLSLTAAGIGKISEIRKRNARREELDDKSDEDKIHILMDEIKDRDISDDHGWFRARTRAAESLAQEVVTKLKERVTSGDLSPSELKRAKEVLEKYRNFMTTRHYAMMHAGG